MRLLGILGTFFIVFSLSLPTHGFEWVPSDEEIQKYRKSWNPFSHGPILLQSVDIQPKGQMSVRPFLFSQIGEHSYGTRLTIPTPLNGRMARYTSTRWPHRSTAATD